MGSIKNHKIVMVKWNDAYSSNGYSKPDVKPFAPMVVIGFLVKKRDDAVVLGWELDPEDGSYRHYFVIPRPIVKSITVLATVAIPVW